MSDQKFQLLVQKGPEPGKVFQLTSVNITVGRDPMADITIGDPEVSRRHARLVGTLLGYRIQDLGSTNGTFIDGVRLGGEPVELKLGQVISIGSSVVLIFQSLADEEDQSATMLDISLTSPELGEQEREGVSNAAEPVQDIEKPSTPVENEKEDEEMEGVGGTSPADEELDQPPIIEPIPLATEWEQPLQQEPVTPFGIESQSAPPQPKAPSEPVVIAHHGDQPQSISPDTNSNTRRLSTIIAAVLLLLICCSCSFMLFLYYYGGDWVLGQMGLLP